MPLNREFIGRTTRSAEPIEITRGDIRRFAAALGDANPVYRDRAAAQALGHRDVVAPPTFLITTGTSSTSGFITDPSLGLDYARVVHGEQKFELHRPVCAGDVLETEIRVADIRDAGRNELMQLVTEFRSGDELVATATNTIVSRGTAAAKEA